MIYTLVNFQALYALNLHWKTIIIHKNELQYMPLEILSVLGDYNQLILLGNFSHTTLNPLYPKGKFIAPKFLGLSMQKDILTYEYFKDALKENSQNEVFVVY